MSDLPLSGVRQQLTCAPRQRGVAAVGDDALQPLQRAGHHAPIRVGEQPLEVAAIPRGVVDFRRDAAPAPVRVRRRGGRRRDAGRAVRLCEADERLPTQGEHLSGEPGLERLGGGRAADGPEGRLGLDGDAGVGVGGERRDVADQGAVAQGGHRPERVDAHPRVPLQQQRAQARG